MKTLDATPYCWTMQPSQQSIGAPCLVWISTQPQVTPTSGEWLLLLPVSGSTGHQVHKAYIACEHCMHVKCTQ